MPANPWELRADARPLEVAAARWDEVAAAMARHADEIVQAARRATEGWDAAAAESYDVHRRQVLDNLDRFTEMAARIAGSLRATGALVASAQKELDRSWSQVALVPHDVVGESRVLVLRPTEDGDRGAVARGQSETDDIRRRLTVSLDAESTRLRDARAGFVMVRAELTALAGGSGGGDLTSGAAEWGVGSVAPASTSVPGSAQSEVAASTGPSGVLEVPALPVPESDLTGLPASGLSGFVAAAAAGAVVAARSARPTTEVTPRDGGTGTGPGVGAMGPRGATTSRRPSGGRSGARRPQPQPGRDVGESARTSRDKAPALVDRAADREADREAEREAKRAVIEEKRTARAARKAEREAGRRERERSSVEDADAPDADR